MGYTPSIRLCITDNLAEHVQLTLDKGQSHYVCNVMRQKEGSHVLLFNGRDGEWLAEIVEANKKHTVLQPIKKTRDQNTEPDIWLLFAPVKNVALHLIAQKATELGVTKLQPVLTQYTVVPKVNTEKLLANAIEAAEQCERLTVPEVADPIKLEKLLKVWPRERALIFCDESGAGKLAQEVLPVLSEKKYAVLIGPEGGFSAQEQEVLHKMEQTYAIGLGPRILRADTAAISALTAVQLFVGDWNNLPRFS